MGDKRVDERAVARARCRVHDHARGLVDDDQVGVLEDHRKWNRLTARRGFGGGLVAQLVGLALGGRRRGIGDCVSVQQNPALSDEPRDPRPRQVRFRWRKAGERLIKAAGGICPDRHTDQPGADGGF
jgi:hypothetical protein